ncbi:MAG TPA: NUDIX hydrolase [Gemmatimonadota bacterium]|nr:NUDIX hydrolase [Gemmatimonadota bacterium]
MMPERERTIGSRRVFDGRLLRVCVDRVELSGGGRAEREVVHHPGAAAILPVRGRGTDPTVILLRQYRHAVGEVLWEVPAGTLEPGEDAEGCAGRELREETGYVAGALEPLGAIWTSPGFCDERVDLFLATRLERREPDPEPEEDLVIEEMPLSRALEMVADGTIADAKTTTSLLLAWRRWDR